MAETFDDPLPLPPDADLGPETEPGTESEADLVLEVPGTEPAAATAAPSGRRETTGGVLGVGFGLLVALIFLLGLLVPSGGALDGEARARELFGAEPLPFGLEIESAAVLPTGDKVLQLSRTDDDDGRGPDQVVLVQYTSMKGLAGLFQSDNESTGETLAIWEKDPTWSWETILERDEIRWGQWRSKFARVRHFEKGGDWTESARVDLSQAERPLALMAKWGTKEAMDEDELVELLNRIEMLEPKDDSES